MNIIFYTFSKKCLGDENIPLSRWWYTVIAMKPYRHRDETRVLSRWNYTVCMQKIQYLAVWTMQIMLFEYTFVELDLTFADFL